MEIKEYSEEIEQYRYTHLKPLSKELCYNLVGLSEEIGEVQAIFKRAIFRDQELDIEHLKEEMGDVMYYWTAICNLMALNPNEILFKNMEKLKDRYQHLTLAEGEKSE